MVRGRSIFLVLLFSVGLRGQVKTEVLDALPEACAKEVTTSTGRPIFLQTKNDLRFGLSAPPGASSAQAPLAIWIDNAGDEPAGVMTCSDLAAFFLESFDVLDESGRRVLANGEVQGGPFTGRRLRMCLRNFPLHIPARSCVHGDFDHPSHDFVKNVGEISTRYVQEST